MGACATKSGDLKVKGEAPLVLDDTADNKSGVVQTGPAADGTCRRSLSNLLKEVNYNLDPFVSLLLASSINQLYKGPHRSGFGH